MLRNVLGENARRLFKLDNEVIRLFARRKKKLYLATVIVLLLIVSFVMACGKSEPASVKKENETNSGNINSASKKVLATVAEAATYEGSDREQLLLEGAKKEGTLNIYASVSEDDLKQLVDGFEKKYGIKVNAWRAPAVQVRQKTIQEASAGKHTFDIVHTSSEEMEALMREGLLQQVKSPYFKDMLPGAIFPHGKWTATYLTVFVQAYNTKVVKKEDLPKTYQDLLDPKWKGKLGVESTDFDWYFTVVKSMGEEKGIQFFKDLVKTNGVSMRKGHSVLNNAVVSGEVPLGLSVYNFNAGESKAKGASIDWIILDPVIARTSGVGMSNKAPHPNAAMLFYDYMLTDGQKIYANRNYIPTTTKIESPMKNSKFTMIDPVVVIDESEKWLKLFEDTFIHRK